ncbi:MAG: PTS sugar transporter subunit IIA [Myxococcota bacterium]
MIGLVLVGHGELARALLDTATEIVGPIEPAVALSVARHENLKDIEDRLRDAVARVDRGSGVLILADMFGGTGANVALQLLGDLPIEVVTGFSLPMLLKLSSAMKASSDLSGLSQLLKSYGQKNVLVASEMLRGREV